MSISTYTISLSTDTSRTPHGPARAVPSASAAPLHGVIATTYLAWLDATDPVAGTIASITARGGPADARSGMLMVPVVVLASPQGAHALPGLLPPQHADVGIDDTVVQQLVDDAAGWARQAWEHASFAARARAAVGQLTPRERDVLDGLASGWPNKVIAQRRAISPRTVEIHRARVMAKLGCASLSHALRIAFAAGLGNPLHGPGDFTPS